MQEVLLAPGTVVGGRYRVLERAGEGGAGVVYRAEDVAAAGTPLALKCLAGWRGHPRRTFERARREFLLLGQHRHAHLVRVLDLVVEPRQGQIALVYEWLGGPDLATAPLTDLLRDAAARERELVLLDFLRQALAALAYLHLFDLRHGDVNLRNLRFEAPLPARSPGPGGPPLPALRLVDYGLTDLLPQRHGGRTGPRPAGVVAETSPGAGPAAFRRDLRELAGAFRILASAVTPAGAAPERAFPAFWDLLARLDAPTPSGRLETARAALAATEAALGPAAAATRGPVRPAPASLPFVGRERELAEVAAWLERTAAGVPPGAGRPALVVVAGEEGSGRSTFLDQVRRQAAALAFRALAISGPLAWAEGFAALAALAAAAAGTAPVAAALRAACRGRDGTPVPPDARAPATRALLRDGLAAVARAGPLLLLFDDLDRATAADRDLFLHAAGPRAAGDAERLCACASVRTDRAIEPIGPATQIDLAPLGIEEVRRLVAPIPGAGSEAARWVHARSGGHAGLAVETARWLEERLRPGAAGRAALAAADLEALDRETPPTGIEGWCQRRAAALPGRTQEALVLLSTAEWPLDADDLGAVLAASPTEAAALAADLCTRGFAVATAATGTAPETTAWQPAGPTLARAVRNGVVHEERAALHRRLLGRLRARTAAPAGAWPPTVLCALHALGAGDEAAIVAEGAAALDLLIERKAWEAAAELGHRVLAAVPRSARAARVEALERVVRAEAAAGRTGAALRSVRDLLRALPPGKEPRRRARTLRRQGDLFTSSGRPAQALPAYRQALEATGAADRAGRAEILDRMAYALCLVGRLGEAEAAAQEGLAGLDAGPADVRGSLHNTLGVVAQQAGLYDQARAAYDRALVDRRRARDLAGEADSRYNIAMTWVASGRPAEARTAVAAARGVYQRLRDWVAVGRCRLEEARAFLEEGEATAARRALAEARAVHARCGHAGDDYLADAAEGYLALLAGDPGAARAALERAAAGAAAAADPVAHAAAETDLALAALEAGRPGRARAALERARAALRGAGDRHGEADLKLAEAWYALAVNRPAVALGHATQALDAAGPLHLPRLAAEGTLVLGLAEACDGNAAKARFHFSSAARLADAAAAAAVRLRALAEDPEAFGGGRALAAGLRAARRAGLAALEARLQIAAARTAPTARAGLRAADGALRLTAAAAGGEVRRAAAEEAARLRLALGETGAALAHIREILAMVDESVQDAPEADREGLLAAPALQALREQLARLETALAGGGPAGGDPRAEARARGLRRILDITAELNSTRSTQDLLHRIMDAVFEITRAERGFLALRTSAGAFRFVVTRNLEGGEVADAQDRVSQTICRRVLDSGRPLVAINAQEDAKLREVVSVREEHLTSVLCLPFRVRDRVLGVFYVDNRFQPGAFTAEDVGALEVLAHQAALAIETVRLIEEKAEALRLAEELARRLEAEKAHQEAELHRTRAALAEAQSEAGAAAGARARVGRLLGRSAAMQGVYEAIDRAAAGYQPVLLLGETGTGKELIAREIHRLGPRAKKSFVPVNCAALPPGLEESELFGHAKGAFTGAATARAGLVESADGGTLFLDEVPAMPAPLQAKLLRVLQDGVVRRVGSDHEARVDLRVLAAANEDLLECVRQGRFREDLYYRLRGEEIRVPALRERREDILVLADHFLDEAAARSGKPRRQLDPGALGVLLEHEWPGNVREMEQAMHAVAGRGSGPITAEDAAAILPSGAGRRGPGGAGGGAAPGADLDLGRAYEALQRRHLEAALERSGGNRKEAARLLGVTPQWLYEMMKKFGVR